MLRHVALSESLQVSAKFTEINLRIYGPQVVTAAYTLARHPTSKIAKENLEGKLLATYLFINRFVRPFVNEFIVHKHKSLPNLSIYHYMYHYMHV